ncbi:MAG: hypothetical protein ACK526_22025 [Planctomyces sp.]|jgi:hypothetical protein
MGQVKPFLFGSLLGASTMFVGLQYHIIRSHDGFQLVPRTPQHSVGLAYADIRSWDAAQWTDRPELARALMAHGSTDLISESVAKNLADSVTSESATLDQLRSFLNNPKSESDAPEAAGDSPERGSDIDLKNFFNGRDDGKKSDSDDLSRTGDSDQSEPSAIPFPSDVRPSAKASGSLRLSQDTSRTNSRADDSESSGQEESNREESEGFGADSEFAEGAESESERSVSKTEGSNFSSGKPASRFSAQQIREADDLKTDFTSKAKTNTEDVPQFQEAATDLESRARMALSRAQSTLNNADKSGLKGTPTVSEPEIPEFTRSRTTAPSQSGATSSGSRPGQKPIRSGDGAGSSNSGSVRAPEVQPSELDDTDPFIE